MVVVKLFLISATVVLQTRSMYSVLYVFFYFSLEGGSGVCVLSC